MASSEVRNLQAICEAMDQHDRTCVSPLVAVVMNPYEVERLDWQEVRGVPIKADDEIGTGRFKLVCSGQHEKDAPSVEAVAGQEVAV